MVRPPAQAPSESRCTQLERSLVSAHDTALEAAMRCAESLLEYRGALAVLPVEYAGLSRAYDWLVGLDEVLADPSPAALDACRFSLSEAAVESKQREARRRYGELDRRASCRERV